jgi:hypothetical protein
MVADSGHVIICLRGRRLGYVASRRLVLFALFFLLPLLLFFSFTLVLFILILCRVRRFGRIRNWQRLTQSDGDRAAQDGRGNMTSECASDFSTKSVSVMIPETSKATILTMLSQQSASDRQSAQSTRLGLPSS